MAAHLLEVAEADLLRSPRMAGPGLGSTARPFMPPLRLGRSA